MRRQGIGTFVNRHSRDRMMFYFFHVEPIAGPKEYPVVDLVGFARERATREQARRLAIDERAQVVRFRNSLSVRGRVAIVDDITIAAGRFKGLTERMLRDRDSTIYELYQQRFGHENNPKWLPNDKNVGLPLDQVLRPE